MSGIYGADVSALVSTERWMALRNLTTPIGSATVRCYEQRNGGVIDPNCISNLKNARAAGIDSLSVYHFPSKTRSAREQTETSIANLANSGLTLDYYWLDVEPSPGYDDWSTNQHQNNAFIAEWYQAAVDSLAAHPSLGCDQVGFYTRSAHWPSITGNSTEFAHTPLWFVYMFLGERDGPRSYDRFEPFGGWTEPTQVQWSLDVPFPDVSPPGKWPAYDLNWGPATSTRRAAPPRRKAKSTVPTPQAQSTTTTYTVQPGDTFDGLVAKFGLTKAALAHANNIIDPNKIAQSPGWVITIPGAPASPAPSPTPTAPARATTGSPAGSITVRAAMEIIGHESIVKEAYKDSRGVWTWSVGLTNSCGHHVSPKYIDNPQSLTRCLEVFEWALRTNYAAKVDEVFAGFDLSEEQYAAALSFHFNTGGIGRASWVREWKAGQHDAAYSSFMNWKKPAEIIPRRAKERDLFFNSIWSSDGTVLCCPVRKPSYEPNFSSAYRVEIHEILEDVLARAGR